MSRFMRRSVKDLPEISVPALIMQSETDMLLNEQNAYSIYNKLGSKDKRIFFVPDSYHVFCLDKNKKIAFKEIFKFINETSQKNGIRLGT
jgi:carboxylesterase